MSERTRSFYVTVRIEVKAPPDILEQESLDPLLDEMEYNFTLPEDSKGSIVNSEILSYREV